MYVLSTLVTKIKNSRVRRKYGMSCTFLSWAPTTCWKKEVKKPTPLIRSSIYKKFIVEFTFCMYDKWVGQNFWSYSVVAASNRNLWRYNSSPKTRVISDVALLLKRSTKIIRKMGINERRPVKSSSSICLCSMHCFQILYCKLTCLTSLLFPNFLILAMSSPLMLLRSNTDA